MFCLHRVTTRASDVAEASPPSWLGSGQTSRWGTWSSFFPIWSPSSSLSSWSGLDQAGVPLPVGLDDRPLPVLEPAHEVLGHLHPRDRHHQCCHTGNYYPAWSLSLSAVSSTSLIKSQNHVNHSSKSLTNSRPTKVLVIFTCYLIITMLSWSYHCYHDPIMIMIRCSSSSLRPSPASSPTESATFEFSSLFSPRQVMAKDVVDGLVWCGGSK